MITLPESDSGLTCWLGTRANFVFHGKDDMHAGGSFHLSFPSCMFPQTGEIRELGDIEASHKFWEGNVHIFLAGVNSGTLASVTQNLLSQSLLRWSQPKSGGAWQAEAK